MDSLNVDDAFAFFNEAFEGLQEAPTVVEADSTLDVSSDVDEDCKITGSQSAPSPPPVANGGSTANAPVIIDDDSDSDELIITKEEKGNGVLRDFLRSWDPNAEEEGGSELDRLLANPHVSTFLNQDAKRWLPPALSGFPLRPMLDQTPDPDADAYEEVELGHAETFADYMPAKLRIGVKHPDPVMESSSLASVEPADITYKLALPQPVISEGRLSALQLESISYACQRHERFLASKHRSGFLIGDGAGVGKGRTIAGIIYENYMKGRKKALWFSISNDLKYDAERDLSDIGCSDMSCYGLQKLKYGRIQSSENGSIDHGIIFSTYSSLIGSQTRGGHARTRLDQLIDWCGVDFDGCVVFDESHRAKNLYGADGKPTKTAVAVLALQDRLPLARVVYSSATGATEPRNMAYMSRLGLWGPRTSFRSTKDFIGAVEKRGVGAMEMVAMDMKLRGLYIARQLSFQGTSFTIDQVELTAEFIYVYDKCCDLWETALNLFEEAVQIVAEEAQSKPADWRRQNVSKHLWGQFWSSHQRFFKYLTMSAKVRACVKRTQQALAEQKCVIIGLQSTGEARMMDALDEAGGDLNEFVSTTKGVFQSLLDKQFPGGGGGSGFRPSKASAPELEEVVPTGRRIRKPVATPDDFVGDSDLSLSSESESDYDPADSDDEESNPFAWLEADVAARPSTNRKRKLPAKTAAKAEAPKKRRCQDDFPDSEENISGPADSSDGLSLDARHKLSAMKNRLQDMLEELAHGLPTNTLDELIDLLGGPSKVSEMTGRKGRMVQDKHGRVHYQQRTESEIVSMEMLNIEEKERFMNGEKLIAVISDAASSGISLQADKRRKNTRRRVHITLELAWSADKAVQQFGRSHRSNQASAPEYVFLISALAGEQRFASSVAKRLESLGALTHGDRRATESQDLSQFNLDNKYGRLALDKTLKTLTGMEYPIASYPTTYSGNFLVDACVGLAGVGILRKTSDSFPGHAASFGLLKNHVDISKFLNRLLGLKVDLQNAVFQYFVDTHKAIVYDAKKSGNWDMGILDLGQAGENCEVQDEKSYTVEAEGDVKYSLMMHLVRVERGMKFDDAFRIYKDCTSDKEGFYLNTNPRMTKPCAMLVTETSREKVFNTYRPHLGMTLRRDTLQDITGMYRKATPDQARQAWNNQYEMSSSMCVHRYNFNTCKAAQYGAGCEVGLRQRRYWILSGSVLSVWPHIEHIISKYSNITRFQIVRMQDMRGGKVVGFLIPNNVVEHLMAALEDRDTSFVGYSDAALDMESGAAYGSDSD